MKNLFIKGLPDDLARQLKIRAATDPDNQRNRGQVFHARLNEHIRDFQSAGWKVIVNNTDVYERPGSLNGGADRLYIQLSRQ